MFASDAPSSVVFVRDDDASELEILKPDETHTASRCVQCGAVTITDDAWLTAAGCIAKPDVRGKIRFWQDDASRALWFGRQSSARLTFVDAHGVRKVVLDQHQTRPARMCAYCHDVVVEVC